MPPFKGVGALKSAGGRPQINLIFVRLWTFNKYDVLNLFCLKTLLGLVFGLIVFFVPFDLYAENPRQQSNLIFVSV